jgi:hypothetical protein
VKDNDLLLPMLFAKRAKERHDFRQRSWSHIVQMI